MFELADCLVVIYKTINQHFKELTHPDPQPNLTQTPAKTGLSQPAVV